MNLGIIFERWVLEGKRLCDLVLRNADGKYFGHGTPLCTFDVPVPSDGLGLYDLSNVNALIDRATLMAASPLMIRALLANEWSGTWQHGADCPECGNCSRPLHNSTCSIDMALTSAGFPDAESRDLAREKMEEVDR